MKNVILITLDATRKDALGCYGNTKNLTPFIDSMQNKSVVFTKGQSIGPYTQASFPGILTSSYPVFPISTRTGLTLSLFGISNMIFSLHPTVNTSKWEFPISTRNEAS